MYCTFCSVPEVEEEKREICKEISFFYQAYLGQNAPLLLTIERYHKSELDHVQSKDRLGVWGRKVRQQQTVSAMPGIEEAFCYSVGNSTGSQPGMDIIDICHHLLNANLM